MTPALFNESFDVEGIVTYAFIVFFDKREGFILVMISVF